MGHHQEAQTSRADRLGRRDIDLGSSHDGAQPIMDHNSHRDLRYGLNPHQGGARLVSGGSSPLAVLSGNPGYINLLDALRGWKLVRELRRRFDRPAAASFKHVNPAGAGLGGTALPDGFLARHFLGDLTLSPLSTAYLRARQADRLSSYGDFVALSDIVDVETAEVLRSVASDGIIAPGFTTEALRLLRRKREGRYLVLAIDPSFEPGATESRTEFGLTLTQDADTCEVPDPRAARTVSKTSALADGDRDDLLLAMIVAKHTQSNAVVIAMDGQTIGIGAGQQSRISATQLACATADAYRLQQHPKLSGLPFAPALSRIEKMNLVDMALRFAELGVSERQVLADRLPGFHPLTASEREAWLRDTRSICLASDAFIPFRDNIDRAARSHVTHIMQTGGSLRDGDVTAAANEYGMVMLHSGARHFLH
jgi:phosphoribosylaminoimidazolecarboxamide formyltransferase/IMP cyclohydrolase